MGFTKQCTGPFLPPFSVCGSEDWKETWQLLGYSYSRLCGLSLGFYYVDDHTYCTCRAEPALGELFLM